jgi:hypothetical protein
MGSNPGRVKDVSLKNARYLSHPNESVFEDGLKRAVDAVADVLDAHAGPQDDGVVEVRRMACGQLLKGVLSLQPSSFLDQSFCLAVLQKYFSYFS